MNIAIPNPAVTLATATALIPGLSLPTKLDAVLLTLAAVRNVGVDPVVEALAASQGFSGDGELAVRRLRLFDGRSISVAALPSMMWHRPTTRAAIRAIRRSAMMLGRRFLLVTEASLDREPRLGNALLVAECAGAMVAPRDRLALLAALLETGGYVELADAAEVMISSGDPVAAVLSLVARRVLTIDMDQPIGPNSTVAVARSVGRP